MDSPGDPRRDAQTGSKEGLGRSGRQAARPTTSAHSASVYRWPRAGPTEVPAARRPGIGRFLLGLIAPFRTTARWGGGPLLNFYEIAHAAARHPEGMKKNDAGRGEARAGAAAT